MPKRATYREHGDGCAAARALDLIGDRWTVVIIRELLLHPKRFRELQDLLPGVTPAVLTARLRELGDSGLLSHGPDDGPATYGLTERGKAFWPVLEELGWWASGFAAVEDDTSLTPNGVLLAMLTVARRLPRRADVRCALTLYDERLRNPRDYTYSITWTPSDLAVTETASNTDAPRISSGRFAEVLFDQPIPNAPRDELSARLRSLVKDFRRAMSRTGTAK
ncbi:helix-turn-helix domain-containing protein [Saccharomonospora sp. NPDC006951]